VKPESKEIFQFPGDPNALSEAHARRWMEISRDRLAHAVVRPPNPWRKAQIQGTWFPGQCFLRAIQFLRESPHLPDPTYVFGEAISGGLQQHGWVEIGDVVFDGVQQEFYSRPAYYETERVVVWYRFTRKAAMLLHRQQKRLPDQSRAYRWDDWLGLPWADTSNPMTVTEAMARELCSRSPCFPARPAKRRPGAKV
jgi:hypothetical protein